MEKITVDMLSENEHKSKVIDDFIAEIKRLIELTKSQDDTIQEQAKLIESYKEKDEEIARLKIEQNEIAHSHNIATTKIAELEAMIQKMKCCQNCIDNFYGDSCGKPCDDNYSGWRIRE